MSCNSLGVGNPNLTNLKCVISTKNSSTVNLTSSNNYTFTGTWEQDFHPDVMINFRADQECTVLLQFSNDGIVLDSTLTKLNTTNINEFSTSVKGARYFRVVITSDSLTTTLFRLQVQYGMFRQGNAPANLSLSLDADAMNVRPTDFQDEVRIGRRSGVDTWTKFAYRNGLTSSGGEQTIWASSGNFTPLTSTSTFTISYNNSTDGLGTTGALSLAFYYIDSNGLPTISAHILGNTGTDVTSFSGLGINRIAVASSGTASRNTNDITVTATTGGSTQAVIPALGSVTQQAIFFNGSNHLSVVKYLRCNVSVATKTAKVLIKGYVYSRVVDTTYEIYREEIDTAVSLSIPPIEDTVGFVLNPTDVLYFVADSDENNVDINNMRFSLNEYQRT